MKEQTKTAPFELDARQMELIASQGWLARKRYAKSIKLRSKKQKLIRKIAQIDIKIIDTDKKNGICDDAYIEEALK